MDNPDFLESLWDRLLSGQAELIRSAFADLTTDEQQAVVSHLNRMASETGWLPEQVTSAQAALNALGR